MILLEKNQILLLSSANRYTFQKGIIYQSFLLERFVRFIIYRNLQARVFKYLQRRNA